jgi:hypothetical protein
VDTGVFQLLSDRTVLLDVVVGLTALEDAMLVPRCSPGGRSRRS